jgi:hypothetical protein
VPGRLFDAAPSPGRKNVQVALASGPPADLTTPTYVGYLAATRARAPSRQPAMYEPATAAGPGTAGGSLRAAAGGRPNLKSPGPGCNNRRVHFASDGEGAAVQRMGLYRGDLGICVLDPESPRHATRSSVARGPSSPQQGTANSEEEPC